VIALPARKSSKEKGINNKHQLQSYDAMPNARTTLEKNEIR